jgi:hypothetical protein
LAATRWLRHDGRRSLVVANGKFSILDALATINIGDPATTIPHLDAAALAGKDIDLTGVAFTVANVAADSKYEPSIISMRSFPRCSQTAALITLSPPDHKRFQGRRNQAAGDHVNDHYSYRHQ